MGFGSATKKISKVADMAEEVYKRLNELREQVQEMRETVQSTSDRVERLERTVEGQTVVIEALAEQSGVDVDQVYAEAAIGEAEDPGGADDGSTATTTDDEGSADSDSSPSKPTGDGPTSKTD
jgi:TolA-binding protein